MIAALSCAGLAWLAGHGLIGLCRPSGRRSSLELEATALLAGLALLAVVSMNVVLAWGSLSPLAGRGLAVALAVPGVLLWRRNRACVECATERAPWTAVQRLLAIALLGFCALAVFAAASSPVQGFDALFHYAYKGKLIFHGGIGGEAWTDQTGAVGRCMTRPTYPPVVPLVEVVVGWLRGAFDEDAARPLWAVFALAPAALIFAALRERGRTPALLAALVWSSTPLLYYWRLPNEAPLPAVWGLAFGLDAAAARFPDALGWQRAASWSLDATAGLPLAAFVFCGHRCLVRARGPAGDRADTVLAGVLLAAALGTKNEGSALVPLLLLAAALTPVGAARPRLVPLVVAAALAAALIAGWWAVRRGLPVVDEDYAARLTPAGLLANAWRAPEVAGAFARSFANVLLWNLLWPIFGLALLHGLRRPAALWRHPGLPAALIVIAAGVVFFAVMLVTPWDLPVLEGTGVPTRLLLQVAPLAVFASFALLWELPGERAARDVRD